MGDSLALTRSVRRTAMRWYMHARRGNEERLARHPPCVSGPAVHIIPTSGKIRRRLLAASNSSPRGRYPGVDDLRQGGILSQRLPGYKERSAQIEMAMAVAEALATGRHALIEAPTGVGKSLAYLVPLVRSGKVAVISTANKALQEQLYYKDIPFVQEHIKRFPAALVKGMGNYVCLDRLQNERVGLQFYAKNRDFMRLLNITEEPGSTFSGDFETLGFQLPSDIRGRVCGDTDQCAWSKCNFYSDCYIREMRAKAERAQV